jgi:hypothetical protein
MMKEVMRRNEVELRTRATAEGGEGAQSIRGGVGKRIVGAHSEKSWHLAFSGWNHVIATGGSLWQF